MSDTRENAILEAAQKMLRKGGYNSFSFRDIAAEIGIKSSSVHYHFATKADLGAAVAKHYTNKFLDALGEPEDIIASGNDPIDLYTQMFRGALTDQKGMCLFGMFGVEKDVLPENVVAETNVFFERNVDWLEKAYELVDGIVNKREKAIQTIALIEGAMMISNTMNDVSVFDSSIKAITPMRESR